VVASGSGTTTLARALANHWSVPHADADDYFWMPTDPPYVEKRPESDRLSLLRNVFVPREAWVADRDQPVLRLDSAANGEDLLETVLHWVPDR
jgi:hypothetical protein